MAGTTRDKEAAIDLLVLLYGMAQAWFSPRSAFEESTAAIR